MALPFNITTVSALFGVKLLGLTQSDPEGSVVQVDITVHAPDW